MQFRKLFAEFLVGRVISATEWKVFEDQEGNVSRNAEGDGMRDADGIRLSDGHQRIVLRLEHGPQGRGVLLEEKGAGIVAQPAGLVDAAAVGSGGGELVKALASGLMNGFADGALEEFVHVGFFSRSVPF